MRNVNFVKHSQSNVYSASAICDIATSAPADSGDGKEKSPRVEPEVEAASEFGFSPASLGAHLASQAKSSKVGGENVRRCLTLLCSPPRMFGTVVVLLRNSDPLFLPPSIP